MNIFIQKEEPSFFVTWISLQSLQESEKIHLWKLLHTWSTKIKVTLDKINSYNGYLPAIPFSAVKMCECQKKNSVQSIQIKLNVKMTTSIIKFCIPQKN